MPRKTIKSLEDQIANLRPFEEYFYVVQSGCKPKRMGNYDGCKVTLIGEGRCSGGIVIESSSSGYRSISFAESWASRAQKGNPYLQGLSRAVIQAIKDAHHAK